MQVQKYLKLKKQVEKLEHEISRCKGLLDAAMERLRNEFDCETIEKAKKLLLRLRRDEKQAERQFRRKYNRAVKLFKVHGLFEREAG